MDKLILELYQIQAVQFGSFTLKSGIVSPIYIDMRCIISYPSLMKQIAEALFKKIEDLSFDRICGVPYAAVPLTTVLSCMHDLPMLMCRKEAKAYGTKKLVEGVYAPGQSCLLIEDVISSGASIFETVGALEKEGLEVRDVAVLVDREQRGKERLKKEGVTLHSLFTISNLLHSLEKAGKISHLQAEQVIVFLKNPSNLI